MNASAKLSSARPLRCHRAGHRIDEVQIVSRGEGLAADARACRSRRTRNSNISLSLDASPLRLPGAIKTSAAPPVRAADIFQSAASKLCDLRGDGEAAAGPQGRPRTRGAVRLTGQISPTSQPWLVVHSGRQMTMRFIRDHFAVTRPDIEPMKFKSCREAKDWHRSLRSVGITGPDIEPMKFKSRREAKDWYRSGRASDRPPAAR